MIKVAAAIIEKQNTVLAARRKPGGDQAGYWEFPGGKIEADETPEQCLERELFEEFGILSRIGARVGQNTHHYIDKSIRLIAYLAEHIGGEFELREHDKIAWLTQDQLNSVEWAAADILLVEAYKASKSTSNYYNENAKFYFDETLNMSMSEELESFIARLKPGSHVLDLGCGSGRDSKIFKDLGFKVTAIDGSAEIAKHAAEYLGQPVEVCQFEQLYHDQEFDAVWACASLLHVHQSQIASTVSKVIKALKPGGLLYVSFKYGETQSYDHKGRYFNNYTETTLRQLFELFDDVTIERIWRKSCELRGSKQRWVSGVLKKS